MKIDLSDQSVDASAEIISGGSVNGSTPSIGLYRPAWRLESWFKGLGITFGSHQESRLPARKTAIREAIFIDNETLLKRLVESAADPRDFINDPDRHVAVVEYLNRYLHFDGLKLKQLGRTMCLVEASETAAVTGELSALAAGIDFDTAACDLSRALDAATSDPEISVTAACAVVESDIAFGKLMNAGQTCIATDYILVQRAKLTELVTALVSEIHHLYPAATAPEHYTSLVGSRAQERLLKGVEECRERSVKIVEVDIPFPQSGTCMRPTLLIDPPMDCLLMEEEIFGPVLPIVPYDTINDAISFVCSRPHPLALYIFSREKAVQRKILEKTISGNVTINGTLLHITQNDLPFGGVGPSGIGAYHGHEGFKRFSHAKGIAKVRFFNSARLAAPPYGRVTSLLAKFLKR